MEKQKILVTGASGFIGSNLVERLLSEGHEVIGIDKDESKKHLLDGAFKYPKFTMVWDDINDIESAMTIVKIDSNVPIY